MSTVVKKNFFTFRSKGSVSEDPNVEMGEGKPLVSDKITYDDKASITIYVIPSGKPEDTTKALNDKFDSFIKHAHKMLGKNLDKKSLSIKTNNLKVKDKSILEVTINDAALDAKAEIDGIQVQLNPEKLKEWIKAGEVDCLNEKQQAENYSSLDNFSPYQFINVCFRVKFKKYLVETNLSTTNKLKMAVALFDLEDEKKCKIDSWFSLHDKKINVDLPGNPFETVFKKDGGDSFDKIKNYYGEQIGLYFRFVVHFQRWTLPLGLLGVFAQSYVWYTQYYESPFIALYAVLVILWATLLTENWKREQGEIIFRWGMVGFEKEEQNRPEFVGEKKPHMVTGEDFMYQDYKQHLISKAISTGVTIFIMLCVVATTFSIYVFKSKLQVYFQEEGVPSQYSATVASFMNTGQILIFKYIYSFVSVSLNNFENHRTETEYEDSMISKLTMFSFVNSYVSFFYIAFVAQYQNVTSVTGDDTADGTNQCGLEGCMSMLSQNLLIIIICSLTSDKFTEFILPYITLDNVKRLCCKDSGLSPGESSLQLEAERDTYDFITGRLADFTTLFVMFGYLVMFSPALPLAAFFYCSSLYVETRADLGKLYTQFRRPQPKGCEDIGAWQNAFEVITTIGVISNAGMIVFTMGMFSKYTFDVQIWIFIIMQWTMFGLIKIGNESVDENVFRVQLQKSRTTYFEAALPQIANPGFNLA